MTQEDWSGTGEASEAPNAGSWSEPNVAPESAACDRLSERCHSWRGKGVLRGNADWKTCLLDYCSPGSNRYPNHGSVTM